MDELESKCSEIVLRVATEKGIAIQNVAPNMKLIQEIGLKSMDLARIIALLEGEFHVDPFAELVPITSIRTVSDLANAYQQAIDATE
ncbi:MAG: phosphopantetheine-binding protein [Spirochaetota bacterium]